MSKRIDTKVSITAQGTRLMRAISYYEKNPCYKSGDYVAPLLLPWLLHAAARHGFTRKLLQKRFFKVPGIYEFVIARTKFIDDIFARFAVDAEQVLIFGAGFDSRALRFRDKLAGAKVFELDAPVTQQAKINRLKEINVEMPENLTFVSVDFTKESLATRLDEAGFQKGKRCLFLLEGLIYYLDRQSVDSTFKLLTGFSGNNSLLVFDYASAAAVRQENIDPRIKEHYQSLARAGEKPGFAIEGDIRDFLDKYDFALADDMDDATLVDRYFAKEDFGVMTKRLRIATARKKSVPGGNAR